MPAITKRTDGRYQAALQVNGTRRFVYGKTRREVEQKLAVLQRQAGGGSLPSPGNRTVADLVARVLGTVGQSLKPKTLAVYQGLANRYILPSLGSVRLGRLSPDHLQGLYQTLPGTRVPSQVHRLLHRLLRMAVVWGWLAENPADRVIPPAYTAPRRPLWTQAELATFLAAARGHRWAALWLVLLGSGLRLGEALGLTWEDLDLERGQLSVSRSAQWIGGQWVVSRPKTRTSERTLALPAEVISVLQTLREARPDGREAVFTTRTGARLLPVEVEHELAKLCDRLGLRRQTVHQLRHLHASLLLAGGRPIPEVSRRLGHSTPHVTMTIYAHALGLDESGTLAILDHTFCPSEPALDGVLAGPTGRSG